MKKIFNYWGSKGITKAVVQQLSAQGDFFLLFQERRPIFRLTELILL